ncbi:MAG: hypothetical protein IPM23_15940 [Candidatus Melainabacteria bacterium]|nr:hypothetical protein [Candidatus Melainabacteria bacterium]
MYTDNSYAIHLLGFMLIGFCLFEAWQGKLYGNRGQTEFDKEPLRFAVGGGLQLAIGILIALDTNWTRGLGYQSSVVLIPGLCIACSVFFVVTSRTASLLTKRTPSKSLDSGMQETTLHLGPPTIGVLALFLFWVLIAVISPAIFADLTQPALTWHYFKSLTGICLIFVLWTLMGISFCFPYKASVDSDRLYLKSLLGITAIPLCKLVSVHKRDFLISFVTSDKKYIMVNCFTDSPEHRASTRKFLGRLQQTGSGLTIRTN